MKISEADILIIPGFQGSPDGHWQHGWVHKIQNAQFVDQEDWNNPDLDKWVENILQAIMMATRPVVLVGHSLGNIAIAHAAKKLADSKVIGALLVAAPDLDRKKGMPKQIMGFAPIPRDPLPFPSMLIASSNDPFSSVEASAELAAAWGSAFNNAGELGHINPAAGFGPWPEGLMAFANLMKRL